LHERNRFAGRSGLARGAGAPHGSPALAALTAAPQRSRVDRLALPAAVCRRRRLATEEVAAPLRPAGQQGREAPPAPPKRAASWGRALPEASARAAVRNAGPAAVSAARSGAPHELRERSRGGQRRRTSAAGA